MHTPHTPHAGVTGTWQKISKLLPLIKLLRLLRIGRIFNRLFKVNPQAAKITRILKMVTGLLITSHLFGCFFWSVLKAA